MLEQAILQDALGAEMIAAVPMSLGREVW